MQDVNIAKTGHFYKIIPNFGMLVYSPFNSLTYAIPVGFTQQTIDFLNGANKVKLPKEIKVPLMLGKKNIKNSAYSSNHLLPDESYWVNYSQPNEIITVNWFLTGYCNFDCKYCYASDLMYNFVEEPTEKDIERIATQILKLNPLNIVLTGGEPLLSSHILLAIKLISRRAGIIIDTNGTILEDNLLKIIKENNIVIRISLDSPRPSQNKKHRQTKKESYNSYNQVLDNIIKCSEFGIPIIIQTVVSSVNKNELEEFGEILIRLGISGWRLLKVQESKLNSSYYNKLMLGRTKKLKDASAQIDYQLENIIKIHKKRWSSKISLQVSKNNMTDRNSVILVSPNGKFWTESKLQISKNLIDKQSPEYPDENLIFKKVNSFSHFSRYLNIH